ncbi:MAG: helix-turn-helix domain-containing protein [Alphaproteobacteria bacterium]
MDQQGIDRLRAYLRHACDSTGLSATALARRAGVAPSTVNRFLNEDPPPSVPSNTTLRKIADAAGIEPFGRYREGPAALGSPAAGLGEDQAAFIADASTGLDRDPPGASTGAAALLAQFENTPVRASLWQVKGAAMELAGLLDGDTAVVDLNGAPQRGCIVLAQLYDWTVGTARTVFRLWDPPYLVAASRTPLDHRPELAGEQAQVKGVVRFTYRTYS